MTSPSPKRPRELLQLTGISLHYGNFRALNRIHLTLAEAEVHAVVGEHGAGKSSLGLMLNGILQPSAGTIAFEGKAYAAYNVTTALKLGIRMIYQQVHLYEEFTVAENLFLTNPTINRFAWRPRKRFIAAARALLAQYHFELDPAMPVRNLNLSDQTVVEFLKHLASHPKLLILDEALERLSAAALHKILSILLELKQAGLALLVITHRLDDIDHLVDRVSIIKNGELLLTDQVNHLDKIQLIKMAYLQIAAEPKIENVNQEFSQLLKYNEAILRHLPVNLLVIDPERRIKLVNDYCKQSFELPYPSYLNVPLDEFFAETPADVLELMQHALASQAEKIFYHVPVTLNQHTLISNLKTFPIYDGAAAIGNIIIIEDITEYDQLQKQVILSEKLASVGLLAAGVAHEINNPLGIIANYLSSIKYAFSDPGLHEALDNVHEEITSIANIVGNLHAFSDHTPLTIEDVDLNVLIRSMLRLIQHNAKHKQIAVHFEPSPQDITIQANKNEIKQVILNLLKNSFEAMPAGGAIEIKTTLLAENGAQVAQMTFQDTGPGIGDENPNNIFLPFYSTKKGQEHNLGLGLSVSYGIIKKYNGTIAVKNLENAGCQFIIKLPQSALTG